METLNSKVIDLLKDACSAGSNIHAYMKHILINLNGPDAGIDENKIKTEIVELVEKHFPLREEILPFVVCKNDVSVLEFSIQKSLAIA